MDNEKTKYERITFTSNLGELRGKIKAYYKTKELFKGKTLEERVAVHKSLAKDLAFTRFENKRADFFEQTSFLWDNKDEVIRKHFTLEYLENVLRYELYYNATLIKSQIQIYKNFLNN